MVADFKNKLRWLYNQESALGLYFRKPKDEIIDSYDKEMLDDEIKSLYKGKKFHTAIFESIMIAIKLNDKKDKKFSFGDYIEILKDTRYLDAVTEHTNRMENIIYRVKKVEEKIENYG